MTGARGTRVAVLVALAAAVGGIALLASAGDGSSYRLRMELGTASGLRDGSAVKIAGATVGEVAHVRLDDHDLVQVELALEGGHTVNRGVRVAVRSANLLGEKFVDLTSPRGAPELPSGTQVSAGQVSLPVDLDQALSTLDADTRTRLAILIDESGLALTGRRTDLSTTIQQLPPAFDAVTDLREQVGSDNAALGRLIDRSSGFVGRLTEERRQLTRLVDVAGAGMTTVAARRAALRETLRRTPGTLHSLQNLLADVRRTTTPLKPAAEALSAAAPALRDTLAQLEPFRKAAGPALARAQDVAPLLTKLGREATPTVRRAVPTARDLATFAEGVVPATRTLDEGIDDLMGTVQGWARAIQGRDSIGHLFRGHMNFGPEEVKSLLARLAPKTPSRRGAADRKAPAAPAATTPSPSAAPKAPSRLPKPGVPEVKLPKPVNDVLDRLLQPGKTQDAPAPAEAGALLDFLLGP
jgi:virulence factor Mce-like protein